MASRDATWNVQKSTSISRKGGFISKEEMLEIFDDAATLLSGNAIAMRQALQLLPWLRKELGTAEATKDEDHQEEAREGEAPR